MEYTKLGRSNMTVSKICLGTMHFGPYASEEASHKILDRTLELGINFIDTANVYGGDDKGRSEKIIGNWFARRPEVRDQVVLATKLYNPMQKGSVPNDEAGFSAYKARKQLKDSLERLQTDRIDLYQVHHIDRRVSPEEFWGTYDKMIADGDVLYAARATFPVGDSPKCSCKPGLEARLASCLSRRSTTCSTGFPSWKSCPPRRIWASA